MWLFRAHRTTGGFDGITVREMVDCLIATFAIKNDHSLLHADADFEPFEVHFGLSVLHP